LEPLQLYIAQPSKCRIQLHQIFHHLLLLYLIIIIRIIRIGVISRSSFAKLFCFGFAFSIFIYITVNLSMVLGLLPIVGSPLPIMSYGGSSMLATMIGFGIVLSAKVHSKQTIA